MAAQLELILLGFAVVVDSVLWIALLERVNRPNTAIWLTTLVGATWFAHAAGFVHVMLRQSPDQPFAGMDRIVLIAIAASLLVIPSAMLHAAARLNHSPRQLRPQWDWRFAAAYLPCLMFPFAAWRCLTVESRNLADCYSPFVDFFLIQLIVIACLSAFLFLRYRSLTDVPTAKRFMLRLAVLLVLLALLVSVYGWNLRNSDWDLPSRLLVILSPLSVVSLFLWYALRDKLLPIVFERALVYGGSVALVMLLHQVFVMPIAESMQRKSNLDVILIEGVLLVGIVLAWPPLRGRVRESLRYLLSQNIFQVREAVRQLSLQISQQETQSLEELCDWFTQNVCSKLDVEQVWVWFDDARIDTPRWAARESSIAVGPQSISADLMRQLNQHLNQSGVSCLSRAKLGVGELESVCERVNALYVFRCQFRDLQGVLLMGPRIRSDRFSEEQLSSLALLFDQFAATLFNRMVDQDRLRAERQAAQQEKLAVLGLMAGSLAHEIRNPLSSIQTVASLMREELGAQSTHAQDINIILEEIDRLSTTTQRLLDFSKPADHRMHEVDAHSVTQRLFYLLQPWGAQQQVLLKQSFDAKRTVVRSTDAALSEILLNVLRNAVEATRSASNAFVHVKTHCEEPWFVFRITDNGPGISPDIRETLFRPFVTSKEFGTGLGLYIAAERVRSVKGLITCHAESPTGTTFEIRIPLADSLSIEASS